jgi:hypothetical protein
VRARRHSTAQRAHCVDAYGAALGLTDSERDELRRLADDVPPDPGATVINLDAARVRLARV